MFFRAKKATALIHVDAAPTATDDPAAALEEGGLATTGNVWMDGIPDSDPDAGETARLRVATVTGADGILSIVTDTTVAGLHGVLDIAT